jgi:hypothetical protein
MVSPRSKVDAHQIEKLPTDDIWWNVYGPDQAWNFKNLHRFMPTLNIHGTAPVSTLPERFMPIISEHSVKHGAESLSFQSFLDSEESKTTGVIILHKGHIVFEYYPGQKHSDKTIYWSVTKVFVSALIGILEDRGNINVNLPLVHYLPEVRKSHYALITIRNLLDMATGLDCPENYVDKHSHYYKYSVTVGDGFSAGTTPENPYKFLSNLQPKIIHPQGEFYQYSGVNTFFLSWVIEKLTNMSFHDALSVEIWSKIGAESHASLLASSHGIGNTHGGLISTLRDVARFGLLFSPSYKTVSRDKLISDRVLELIRNGGNRKLWTKPREANQLPTDFSHSIYQWDAIYNNGDFYKGGWAGQGLLVNPQKDVVAVYTGYSIDAEQSQPSLLPILRKVLNELFPARSSPAQH